MYIADAGLGIIRVDTVDLSSYTIMDAQGLIEKKRRSKKKKYINLCIYFFIAWNKFPYGILVHNDTIYFTEDISMYSWKEPHTEDTAINPIYINATSYLSLSHFILFHLI